MIVVLPYDPAWRQAFEDIKSRLLPALGGLCLCIEHVGSTAVPGLSAKPIIDMDAVIPDRSVLPEVIAALEGIGYTHEGDLGIPGREAFRYDNREQLPAHHLYVCARDCEELRRHLAFRDCLRARPEAVREYSRVKEEAAALYPRDIDGYIRYKAPFIEGIYRELNLQAPIKGPVINSRPCPNNEGPLRAGAQAVCSSQ